VNEEENGESTNRASTSADEIVRFVRSRSCRTTKLNARNGRYDKDVG